MERLSEQIGVPARALSGRVHGLPPDGIPLEAMSAPDVAFMAMSPPPAAGTELPPHVVLVPGDRGWEARPMTSSLSATAAQSRTLTEVAGKSWPRSPRS